MNSRNHNLLVILAVLFLLRIGNAAEDLKYEASWDSLKKYKVPQWFEDDKFGIFIHWGVYAVPAFGNEWYPRNMYRKNEPAFEHHRKTWGEQKVFGYKDFIPMFKAEKWDPVAWAELFSQSGAKFIVPVAEHHDGFAMYDSSHSDYCSSKMGPKRDVAGELAKAVREKGMRLGLSSHYAYNYYYYAHSDEFDTNDPHYAGLYGKPNDDNGPTSEEFMNHWFARTTEIIDKYQPDVLWFDFCFNRPEFEPYRQKIAAYYYNKGTEWNKGVVLQYKDKAFPDGTAVLDIERGKLDTIHPMVWQTDTSVSRKSWGYINNDEFKTADSLVDDLIDIVSKNGVLLLNVGPKADGTIPEPVQQILQEIGRWLRANGEAIYGTRPWYLYGQGPTTIKAGSFGENEAKPFSSQDIRFTRKGNTLYVICLDKPAETVTIASLGKSAAPGTEVAEIRLLGAPEALVWSRDDANLTIRMPTTIPGEYAFAFAVRLQGFLLGQPRLSISNDRKTLLAELDIENYESQNYSQILSCYLNGKTVATRKVVVLPQQRQKVQFSCELPPAGKVDVCVGTEDIKSPIVSLEIPPETANP
jgi:alpha-L-fucosidase